MLQRNTQGLPLLPEKKKKRETSRRKKINKNNRPAPLRIRI